MGKKLKDTLLLPKTEFPMRGNLVKREPARLDRWEESGLYRRIQEARGEAPLFVLHDGPPFANGDVHMGTGLNKLLKDFIVKSKSMAGFRVPFIPGWDCHGLPIEFKVVKESRDLDPLEIRKRSEKYARKYIDIQRKSFKRLGVFGDWENPYLTLDPGYEADILRTVAKFIDQGMVYRSKKPVFWSYGAHTALAEAEVEYKDKVSPSIYVKFEAAGGGLPDGASFVIWTTTPWTLPANLAIAVHPEFDYVIGEFQSEDGRRENLVVAKPLLGSFARATGLTPSASATDVRKGRDLEGCKGRHPFLDRESPVITGTFVTDDTGTGQVHVAPGHGADDYMAGVQHGFDILSPVDDLGRFTAEAGLDMLTGRLVFETNPDIIALLDEKGVLLGKEDYPHTYPHCWRSKTPVIFRAVEQYFIRIDELRQKALEEIDKVDWIPHWGRNRIFGTVESRPDWCISRQRTWGVPLPIFHAPGGESIIDGDLARKVADLVEEHGTNIWFELDDAQIAEKLGLPEGTTRCRDTLDVWFDSGASHVAVLDKHPELCAPADIYIEATDQHRGWFQSSLMISIAARGHAPYKTVITHGFVIDHSTGEKISKSGDKPINADHYFDKYGADIVRLWASSVDYKDEVPFSDEIFHQVTDNYRRIRNTLRILLGNLWDFNPETDAVANEDLTLVDRWVLERLHEVCRSCLKEYGEYDFRKVFILLNQFCAVDLSSLYVDITKDRLYCDPADSKRRRATQTAMHRVFDALARLLAPILAYTADEAWEHSGKSGSIHLESFPDPDPAFAESTAGPVVEELLRLRGIIQQQIESARQAKTIGGNLEAAVALKTGSSSLPPEVLDDGEALREFLILSDLTLEAGEGEASARVVKTEYAKCDRCWRHLPSVEAAAEDDAPALCDRCAEVVRDSRESQG